MYRIMDCDEITDGIAVDTAGEAILVENGSLLRFLDAAQRGRLEARRPMCAGCSQNKGLGIVTVRCEAVGCAGVSLVSGRCKRRKWPI